MNNVSPVLSFENNLTLVGRPLRWLVYLWNGIYLASLALTLGAVLWNSPAPWGWREGTLVVLVTLQLALHWAWFIATHYPRWSISWLWLTGYSFISLGLWLVEWRLDARFWWVVWMQVFQLYLALPLKIAIPVASLIFLVFAHFESQLERFFGSPLGGVVERLIPWIIVSMAFSAVAILNRVNQERARLITELQAARQELELAHRQEIELAALRERERLARDLHDSLGHALVALSVQLEAVQRLYPVNPEGASSQINEMKTLTRTSMEALRRTLAGLRAPGLNNRSLAQALADLCGDTGRRAGLEITCRVAPEVDRLNPTVTEALWRVTEEALMNVEKHAAAHHVQVDLHMEPAAVSLRVTDDGIGLPQGLTDQPGHYGLRGMRERIEGLGGILAVSANNPSGTVVEASLPLIGSRESEKG